MANPLSIARLAPQVASQELSVEHLIEQVLGEIGRTDPSVNAFIAVLADRARADARRADADIGAGRYLGPLHGMPIAVKDLVDVEGAPTTAARRQRRPPPRSAEAAQDSPVRQRALRTGRPATLLACA